MKKKQIAVEFYYTTPKQIKQFGINEGLIFSGKRMVFGDKIYFYITSQYEDHEFKELCLELRTKYKYVFNVFACHLSILYNDKNRERIE